MYWHKRGKRLCVVWDFYPGEPTYYKILPYTLPFKHNHPWYISSTSHIIFKYIIFFHNSTRIQLAEFQCTADWSWRFGALGKPGDFCLFSNLLTPMLSAGESSVFPHFYKRRGKMQQKEANYCTCIIIQKRGWHWLAGRAVLRIPICQLMSKIPRAAEDGTREL